MYLTLDGQGELYRQLLRALKQAILDGLYAGGTRLPATRDLAADLRVSRNTVLAAYELLCAEGLAVARGGSGTFVADAVPSRTRPRHAARRRDEPSRYAARLRGLPPLPLPAPRAGLRVDLQYGEPMTNAALLTAWSKSLSYAVARTRTGYPATQGVRELREQLAAWLGRRRGVICEPDDLIVVNGTQQALSLLARVLLDEGDRVAVEDPGYALASQCFAAHGANVLPVPVDGQGLRTALLPQQKVKLAYVTPSHQFPLGISMSLARRMELLQHAARVGCWIVEDDYDGEFGFEGRMLPALRSLDRDDRVVYVGTFSKTILPSLRLGYIVCPQALRRDVLLAKRLADFASPGIEQVALAHFMSSGAYERHLRRASLELRRRRRALVDGLSRHCGGRVVVENTGAGMHLVAWLPGLDRAVLQRLIDAAAERGIGLHGLDGHYASTPPGSALLVGFANASVAQIGLATRVLAQCLDVAVRRTDISPRSDARLAPA
ncbi:MAG TPA: PLP-dependent aminotransferase family protein [Albitalea sp.]